MSMRSREELEAIDWQAMAERRKQGETIYALAQYAGVGFSTMQRRLTAMGAKPKVGRKAQCKKCDAPLSEIERQARVRICAPCLALMPSEKQVNVMRAKSGGRAGRYADPALKEDADAGLLICGLPLRG